MTKKFQLLVRDGDGDRIALGRGGTISKLVGMVVSSLPFSLTAQHTHPQPGKICYTVWKETHSTLIGEKDR